MTASSSQSGFKKVQIAGRDVPHLEERNGRFYYRHKVKVLDENGQPVLDGRGNPKRKDRRDPIEAKTPTEAREIIENLRPQKRNVNNALPNIQLEEHWTKTYVSQRLSETSAPKAKLAERTETKYEKDWRLFIKPVLGQMGVKEISQLDCRGVAARMRTMTWTRGKRMAPQSYAETTIEQVEVTLSSLMQSVVEAGYRNDNPMRNMPATYRAGEAEEERPITLDEILTLDECKLIAAQDENMVSKTAIKLGPKCGARISEICGLIWPNVNLDEGWIDFVQQRARPKKGRSSQTVALKGSRHIHGKKSRRVYIDEDTVQFLREYRQWLVAKGLYKIGGYVFPTRTFNAISQNDLGERLTRYVERAGITRDVTWHSFRHTYASRLFARGLSVDEVAQLLGNTPAVVRKTYIKLIDQDAFAERVRKALAS